MADQQTKPTTSTQQMGEEGYSSEERSQSQFDTTFLQQISSGQIPAQSVDWAAAYFDAVDQQVRVARRIAEASSLQQMKQQIVTEAAQLVLAELRQRSSSR